MKQTIHEPINDGLLDGSGEEGGEEEEEHRRRMEGIWWCEGRGRAEKGHRI